MAYFVTGATGFIGRYLVANLLQRGAPIYVLVRKGSVKKLDALREALGRRRQARDRRRSATSRSRSSASSDADLKKLKGKVDHFFHLAAIYDLKATRRSAAGRQRRRHAARGAVRRRPSTPGASIT